ncbi:hypothetical protein EX30DRAFT_111616 [Ascodesmis nigricans]|uniref:Mid2 domain-containing protein n=1 Tax=Ascodesmis nigricans TaxID=341454 RepID=A0A4S2MS75_9PEZI|nr:hypothetical protein EX30DRAFT_111616 [Ascodesmis nigricans]
MAGVVNVGRYSLFPPNPSSSQSLILLSTVQNCQDKNCIDPLAVCCQDNWLPGGFCNAGYHCVLKMDRTGYYCCPNGSTCPGLGTVVGPNPIFPGGKTDTTTTTKKTTSATTTVAELSTAAVTTSAESSAIPAASVTQTEASSSTTPTSSTENSSPSNPNSNPDTVEPAGVTVDRADGGLSDGAIGGVVAGVVVGLGIIGAALWCILFRRKRDDLYSPRRGTHEIEGRDMYQHYYAQHLASPEAAKVSPLTEIGGDESIPVSEIEGEQVFPVGEFEGQCYWPGEKGECGQKNARISGGIRRSGAVRTAELSAELDSGLGPKLQYGYGHRNKV